ncbi:hypothetical protein LCGC14_0888620, partial [marine sediment metagenome]
VITPVGFLLTKEEFKFTPASGSGKYVLLPTDMPIRKLILSSPSDTVPISAQVGAVVVDEDDGKRTLLDEIAYGLHNIYRSLYGDIREWVVGVVNSKTRDVYIAAGDHVGCGIVNTTPGVHEFHYIISEGCKRTITSTNTLTAFNAVFVGDCPHNTLPVLFGRQDIPEDWWDVTRLGKARIIITPTASLDTGTDVSVITQRLARY